MRKILLTALIVAAAGVYTWDAVLLVRPPKAERLSAKSGKDDGISVEKLLEGSFKVRFVKTDRNPFLPRRHEAVSVVRTARVDKKQEVPVNPPKVTINGIMGDEKSPLVMLTLPDGSSAAVKVGQTVGDITLKKVEKDRVLIVFKKKNFWINR